MSLDLTNGSRHAGLFEVGDHLIPGEISIEASKTYLNLHQPAFFYVPDQPDLTLHGQLTDLTQVSLLNCLGPIIPSAAMSDGERYHSARAEPRYVLFGRSKITPPDKVIRAVRLHLGDAAMIFNDRNAFGVAFDARPEDLAHLIAGTSTLAGLDVELGAHPMVAYYTGKPEVFAVDTVAGRISATHSISSGLGSAEGVALKNQVWVRIAFADQVCFGDAVDASFRLLRFLAIIAGRKQSVLAMKLETLANGKPDRFDVHWPLRPQRRSLEETRDLHLRELPLDAARDPVSFGAILARWLELDNARVAARAQFASCIDQEKSYDVIRLVGAVNMFDLLPADAVAAPAIITPELAHARDEARAIFRALPDGPERSSVLSALGRIGMPVLKRKIRSRAAIVTRVLAKPFPHLCGVIDVAVEARNLFVHGGASELDFSGPLGASLPFLTDLMEFLFAASDLIDCGWDAAAWEMGNLSWDHPMGHVVLGYDAYLRALESALPPTRKLGLSSQPTSTMVDGERRSED